MVADSVPEREYEETVNKARALVAALEEVSGGRGNREIKRKARRRVVRRFVGAPLAAPVDVAPGIHCITR